MINQSLGRTTAKWTRKMFSLFLKIVCTILAGILCTLGLLAFTSVRSIEHPVAESAMLTTGGFNISQCIQSANVDECNVNIGFENDVDVDYMHGEVSQEAYDVLVGAAKLIGGGERPSHSTLRAIENKFPGVTMGVISYFYVFKVTINGESYVLKMMRLENDMLASELDSPYIVKVLMSFTAENNRWMVMEDAGSPICSVWKFRCTEHDIKLLVHDVLHGLNYAHEQGYRHHGLDETNIMCQKDETGKTTGYKIIDFGHGFKSKNNKLALRELQQEIHVLITTIRDYLQLKVKERPFYMGYNVVTYDGNGKLYFIDEDRVLADFLLTCKGYVEHPPMRVGDLLQHPYVTGEPTGTFGDRFYHVEWVNDSVIGGTIHHVLENVGSYYE